MKFLFAAAVAAAGLSAPALVQAEEYSGPQIYASLGYAYADAPASLEFQTAQARLGLRVHKFLGAEVEGAIGVRKDTILVPVTPLVNASVDYRIRHQYAGYAVAYLPVLDRLNLFARVGYGHTRFRISSPTVPSVGVSNDGQDSLNYGGGAVFMFDRANALRVDYTHMDFRHTSDNADVASVAYQRIF